MDAIETVHWLIPCTRSAVMITKAFGDFESEDPEKRESRETVGQAITELSTKKPDNPRI